MRVSGEVAGIINTVFTLAKKAHFEYVTPELMLYVVCQNKIFTEAFENCGGKVQQLDYNLRNYLEEYMLPKNTRVSNDLVKSDSITAFRDIVFSNDGRMSNDTRTSDNTVESEDSSGFPEFSQGMNEVLADAWISAQSSGKYMVELPHIIHAMYELEESYAVYYMRVQGVEQAELLQEMTIAYEDIAHENSMRNDSNRQKKKHKGSYSKTDEETEYNDEEYDEYENDEDTDSGTQGSFWQQYATCLNDKLDGVNPLIGREDELERTMQILCRKDKNNPLHIGEPGVGKTAIAYGLARMLNENRVPTPLKGAKIFSLDLGSLLAGTQYRGDFEKRFKKVMDSISQEEKPIVYIDEIHNIIGAGAVNGGTFDISNMLKPYLAAGHIRFIGATTYEEYKKHFEKSKSLVRRFQNIDIKEPDIHDTVQILEGLKENYEEFHGVSYGDDVLEYAAEMSAKYINERYLPDKAIDLIDEAGAYLRMHPLDQKQQSVNKELIDEILSKTCHIPKQVVESDETESLATLEERLLKRVYGQDEAITQVVNAVKFSRAGLLEEGKPLASLLFVGPTGVGKTEIARSLAEELGVKLLRFDMSEYEEKHTVAKLIGAPAGYVGYEEGGLLTEEIRKHPHAVLLLDEIEKAHPDIYNILLQVMDYATLTDNQGRKADFRNVIIIMTSNAGASRIGKPGIGFQAQDVKADVILEEVKRIFQPEFRNRLNRIVVFQGMNEQMAEQIVEKKLKELQKMLLRKNVTLSADREAMQLVKKKGISVEFGAREIERVIQSEIKPLLVDEILFGALKEGGTCDLTAVDDAFQLNLSHKSFVEESLKKAKE